MSNFWYHEYCVDCGNSVKIYPCVKAHDYMWVCSNDKCENSIGTPTYDIDVPEWVATQDKVIALIRKNKIDKLDL